MIKMASKDRNDPFAGLKPSQCPQYLAEDLEKQRVTSHAGLDSALYRIRKALTELPNPENCSAKEGIIELLSDLAISISSDIDSMQAGDLPADPSGKFPQGWTWTKVGK